MATVPTSQLTQGGIDLVYHQKVPGVVRRCFSPKIKKIEKPT